MNTTIQAQWVKALRSKQYQQGYGKLRPTANTFCCLGVLLDLLIPEGWSNGPPYVSTDGWSDILGTVGRDRIGLTPLQERILIALNDTDKCSFDQIATYIEQEF